MEVGDVKKQVLETLEDLPSDATVEEAIERLYFLAKIQEGLRQAEAGQTVPHEEAKQRLLSD
jgi:predicted transcriptional regulator